VSQVPTPEITEVVDPVGHVQVIYLGPVAPHWECRMVFGDEEQIRRSSTAWTPGCASCRPRPQFRRNRERVNATPNERTCSSNGTSGTKKSPRPAASSSRVRTTRADH